MGLPGTQIDEIVSWRQGLFRELAKAYETAPSEIAMELVNTSYIGGRKFENALAGALNSMGFVAERRGAAGKDDVFLLATIGPGTYSFIFEAKGSKGNISNDDAEVSGAASHRDKAGAEWAIIVARNFVGFEKGVREPAIIGECIATGGVSIMTVEALNQLSAIVEEFSYPLDILKDVFTSIESPAEKLERIRQLRSPTKDFDYNKFLERVWTEQQEEALGDKVAYRRIWQSEWKSTMSFEQFEQRVIALETLAAGRIRVLPTAHEIYMLQSPEIVIMAIEASLGGRGSSHTS